MSIDAIPPLLLGLVGALVQSYLLLRAAKVRQSCKAGGVRERRTRTDAVGQLFESQRIWKAIFLTVVGVAIAIGLVGACGSATINILFTEGHSTPAGAITYSEPRNSTGTRT